MKVRSGFVSNSSSSSFVCSVCETVETGYDGQYDVEVSRCTEYHEWCSNHTDKFTLKDQQRIILADQDFIRDFSEEKIGFIKSGSEELIEDVFDDYRNYIDYEMPESMCPVCTLSSISDNRILRYLLKQSGQKLDEIEADIRSKFNTLNELEKGLE